MNYGSVLRAVLKKNNMKQVDLAQSMGVSQQLAHVWCTRGFNTITLLVRICDAIGISIIDFFKIAEEMFNDE